MTVVTDADARLAGDDGSEKPIIETIGLVKSYPGTDFRAVDGLDLRVGMGEVYGLLGPNGAGKTTTIEILEGLREKDSGDVRVLGLDPWKEGDALHKRIGVIPQGFTFLPYITPREAVNYYASLFDVKVDADEILRTVLLQDSAASYFMKLSGGQKQKMGLALSLVNKPNLVFLDEPTTGLDPQARRAIWEVIRNLKKQGMLALTFVNPEDYDRILPSDKVSILGLESFAPGKNLTLLIKRENSSNTVCRFILLIVLRFLNYDFRKFLLPTHSMRVKSNGLRQGLLLTWYVFCFATS